MKVRMKGTISGTRNGQPWPARGVVAEFPDEEGAALCAAGLGEAVKSEPKPVEAAVVADDSEKATPLTTENAAPVKRGPGRPRKST